MTPASTTLRARQLDEIAEALPQRASALSQLFLTRSSVCVSRTEIGVMRRLADGPRRITELAAEERLSQPGITLLVNRLEDRGWVQRVFYRLIHVLDPLIALESLYRYVRKFHAMDARRYALISMTQLVPLVFVLLTLEFMPRRRRR